ncbi:MAG: helix-turn-helix transcriptional regulator [Pseudomonadota bacterium]
MSDYLTTKELAALLRIKERKVYDLAAKGQLPCSRAHGKLLFPRSEVEAWVTRGGLNGSATGGAAQNVARPARAQVFLGSHDPLLDWALRESRCGLPCFFDGSMDGLRRFAAHEGIATGLHLFDATTEDWNISHVHAACGRDGVVLVEWAQRTRGLIIGAGVPSHVRHVADLKGLRLVARQAEAGSQMHFDHLVACAGLKPTDLDVVETVRSESEAALAILEGKADVAFGLQSLAELYKLRFVPVTRERYDLAIDHHAYFEPALQTLLSFCATEPFRAKASTLAGYDVDGLGRVHWNGPNNV